jgi:hypothetical protein
MYLELMKRFDNGNKLNILHPITDMEIEYDSNHDDVDIDELITASEKL